LEQLFQTPDSAALPDLLEALNDRDTGVRVGASKALSRLEDPDRLKALLKAASDAEPDVQRPAIAALKAFSREEVATALAPLLQSRDAGVRGQAAHTLQAVGWRPESRDEILWFWAAQGQFSRLTGYGAAAIPVLDRVIGSGPFSVCVGAIQALGYIADERAFRPLLAALRSSDISVCVAALGALGKIGNEKVIDSISGMLRNRNGQVRLAAVEALYEMRAVRSAPAVRPLLLDEKWEVRRAAAETLGRFSDSEAVESLTQTLQDADADVRETVAMSLGHLTDRRAIGPLVLALKDGTSGVRRIAAAALTRIDPGWSTCAEAQEALEELRPALEDDNADVRHFVGSVLAGLGKAPQRSKPPQPVPGPDDETTFVVRENRRKLALSLFMAIICDADRDLRQAAAESLGRIGDRRVEPALLRAAADQDASVRSAVSKALLVIQSKPSVAGV
jgi:HEAT repeat protein